MGKSACLYIDDSGLIALLLVSVFFITHWMRDRQMILSMCCGSSRFFLEQVALAG
jgi:hypothetical protein